MFFAGDGNGAVVAACAFHRDLNSRVRECGVVPGPGPVVGGDIKCPVAFEARHDAFVRSAVFESGDDESRVTGRLEESDHGLERNHNAHIGRENDSENFQSLHRSTPSCWGLRSGYRNLKLQMNVFGLELEERLVDVGCYSAAEMKIEVHRVLGGRRRDVEPTRSQFSCLRGSQLEHVPAHGGA